MKFKQTLRAVVAASAIMAAFPAFVSAQDISASHLEAAYNAIKAIKATDAYDNILPQIAENIKAQMIANNPDIEDEINGIVDEETLKLVSRRSDLEKEAANAYARAFTEADLNAITTFYTSDAGLALLSNGAIVSREVQQAAAVWQRGIQRDLLDAATGRLNDAGLRDPADATESATEAAEGAPKAQ